MVVEMIAVLPHYYVNSAYFIGLFVIVLQDHQNK